MKIGHSARHTAGGPVVPQAALSAVIHRLNTESELGDVLGPPPALEKGARGSNRELAQGDL